MDIYAGRKNMIELWAVRCPCKVFNNISPVVEANHQDLESCYRITIVYLAATYKPCKMLRCLRTRG